MKKRELTIVELLIVIVVIAILSAVTIIAYNGVQLRARASSVYAGLRQADKSLRLYMQDTDASAWPQDTAINPASTTDDALASVITNTTLKS